MLFRKASDGVVGIDRLDDNQQAGDLIKMRRTDTGGSLFKGGVVNVL